jgi:GxxExxY protein
VFQQEGYDFMAAAFEVYNEIGYGMAEEIYQQSLEIELSLRKISFLTKQELEVYYKGRKLTTRYKPDLLVFGGIVVELKAVTELSPDHEAQLFNYMRVSRLAVGYLLNFGHKGSLQWKRFILSDLHKKLADEKH